MSSSSISSSSVLSITTAVTLTLNGSASSVSTSSSSLCTSLTMPPSLVSSSLAAMPESPTSRPQSARSNNRTTPLSTLVSNTPQSTTSGHSQAFTDLLRPITHCLLRQFDMIYYTTGNSASAPNLDQFIRNAKDAVHQNSPPLCVTHSMALTMAAAERCLNLHFGPNNHPTHDEIWAATQRAFNETKQENLTHVPPPQVGNFTNPQHAMQIAQPHSHQSPPPSTSQQLPNDVVFTDLTSGFSPLVPSPTTHASVHSSGPSLTASSSVLLPHSVQQLPNDVVFTDLTSEFSPLVPTTTLVSVPPNVPSLTATPVVRYVASPIPTRPSQNRSHCIIL